MRNDRTKLLGHTPIIPTICEQDGVEGLVSVIIPTYNRGYIVGKTIESVLNQTYRDVEIIVVDDGSSDNTKDVIQSFKSKIKYIYQKNSGLAKARNTGLVAAKGEFIAFQDSDDIWLPWKLQAQVGLMKHHQELALVWTDMIAVTPTDQVISDKYLRTMYAAYKKVNINNFLDKSGKIKEIVKDLPFELGDSVYRYGDIYSAMFFGNLVHPPTALLRRKYLKLSGGLDITFAWTCEDYEFFWRVSKHGPGAMIEASSMFYRIDAPDQLTNTDLLLYVARGNLLTLKRRLEDSSHELLVPKAKINKQLSEAYNWVSNEEIKSKDGLWKNALKSEIKSFAINPTDFNHHFKTILKVLLPKPLSKLISRINKNPHFFAGYN